MNRFKNSVRFLNNLGQDNGNNANSKMDGYPDYGNNDIQMSNTSASPAKEQSPL